MNRGWTNLTPSSDFDVKESLGYLPTLLSVDDPRPLKEQISTNYAHGGGYSPFGDGKWTYDADKHTLHYPEDPPLWPIAQLDVRDETMYVYRHAICCIVQKDGTFVVIRMD